jgi:hypothetical protein
MLAFIDNESVKHFHLYQQPFDEHTASMRVWVFTPDIAFSSSIKTEQRTDPTRAMKVLFKVGTGMIEGGNSFITRHEDLFLPRQVFTVVRDALQDSQMLLPATSRSFNGWSVGFLRRFRAKEEQIDWAISYLRKTRCFAHALAAFTRRMPETHSQKLNDFKKMPRVWAKYLRS